MDKIERSKLNIKFTKHGRINKIKMMSDEYVRIINVFINIAWEKQLIGNMVNFIKDSGVDSWLSARFQRAAAEHAKFIIELYKEQKKCKNKPVLDKIMMEINSEFIAI